MDCRAPLAATKGCHGERSAAVYPRVAALGIPIDPHHQSVAAESCVRQHTYANTSDMPPDIKVFELRTDLIL